MHAIRTMTAVLALMRHTPGVSLRDADSREATLRYLERKIPNKKMPASWKERA